MTKTGKACAAVMIFCAAAWAWLGSGGSEMLRKERVEMTGAYDETLAREEFILGAASYFLPEDCPEEAMKAVCVVASTRLERGEAAGFSPPDAADREKWLALAKEYGSLAIYDGDAPADTAGLDAQKLCSLASEGYDHTQLLGHLYPGTVLRKRDRIS